MSFTASTGKVYTLHPESDSYLKICGRKGNDSLASVTVENARLSDEQSRKHFAGDVDFDGTSVNMSVCTPEVPAGLPVSVYTPTNRPVRPSIFVYFHGGGRVIGSRVGWGPMLKTVAMKAGCIVVNVEYRLAPEYKFPAQIDDGKSVMEWVKENKELIGGSTDSSLGVGGDSAGGNITAAVCHEVDGIDFQILIYPSVDLRPEGRRPDYQSKIEFEGGPIIGKEVLKWFHGHFFVDEEEERFSLRLSPIMRSDFTGLPPALFIITEVDPSRDEGCAYHEKLLAAGVSSELFMVEGGIHAFICLPKHFKDLCEESYSKMAAFIKKHTK